MKEFHRLNAIVSTLSKSEISSTINVLRNTKRGNNSHGESLLQLFKLMVSMKNPDPALIKLKLYGKGGSYAFSKLNQRLTEKLLEVILYKENIIKNTIYDKRAKEIFLFREKLLQFDMLIYRGISYDYLLVIDKIIAKAIEFEYYDTLILALIKKRTLLGFRKDRKEYDKLNLQIKHFEYCRDAYNKADQYYHMISEQLNSTTETLNLKVTLPNYIEELNKDYELTRSNQILLCKMYLESMFYSQRGEYLIRYEVQKKILSFVRENSSISSNLRIGTALINLGVSEIQLFDFKNAFNHISGSLIYLRNGPNNTSLAQERIFLIKLYSGDLNGAAAELDKLITFSNLTGQPPYFINKRLYYYSCLKSIQGDITASNKQLAKLSEIDKDKEGWNISIRILLIINQIELDKWDLAERQIDNLRKHVERIKSDRFITRRNLLIQQILFDLSLKSFDFKKTLISKFNEFQLLESQDPEYHWQISSSELIVFEEWYKAKLIGTDYNHKLVMALMKKKYTPRQKDMELA